MHIALHNASAPSTLFLRIIIHINIFSNRKLIAPHFTSIHYDEDGKEIRTDVCIYLLYCYQYCMYYYMYHTAIVVQYSQTYKCRSF